MNTMSSTLKEEIKKSHDSKKKEKFKFIAAILITNIMVAILCLPSKETNPEIKTFTKTHHPNYQMMVLPVEALVSELTKEEKETIVTIVSKDKKVIVQKAYLHEQVKRDNEATHFKIEISNDEVMRVSDFLTEGMLAVPYVESKKLKTIKRVSKYEVSI